MSVPWPAELKTLKNENRSFAAALLHHGLLKFVAHGFDEAIRDFLNVQLPLLEPCHRKPNTMILVDRAVLVI